MGRKKLYFTEEERQQAQRRYSQKARIRRRAGLTKNGLVDQNKESLLNAFKSNGCVACGEPFYGCLDAHHMRDKRYSISELMRHGTIEMLEVELAKCVPLCANCHRKHHANIPVINEDGTRYCVEGYKYCNKCCVYLPATAFEKKWPEQTRRSTCRVCRGRQ